MVVAPGDTLELQPSDLYDISGTAPLVLIVQMIDDIHPQLEWVGIAGTEVGPDGAMKSTQRAVLARVEALSDAVRPVGWLP